MGKEHIIYNMDGVPAVDWDEEKFLLGFNADQYRVLDHSMSKGMDIGCIADPSIPASWMAIVSEAFYPEYKANHTSIQKGLKEKDLRRKRTWVDEAVWRVCKNKFFNENDIRFAYEIMSLTCEVSIIGNLSDPQHCSPSIFERLMYGVMVDRNIFKLIKKKKIDFGSPESRLKLDRYIEKGMRSQSWSQSFLEGFKGVLEVWDIWHSEY